jgi:catechol-2,3-dioxygenase
MPRITGTSHVDLTVSDLDRSVAFYGKALGVAPLMRARVEAEKFEVVYLAEPQSGMILGLVQHDVRPAEKFDPRVAGLDHLSFAVADKEDLHAWASHLDAAGIAHDGYSDQPPIGAGLNFQDPDGIALEFYWISPQVIPAK